MWELMQLLFWAANNMRCWSCWSVTWCEDCHRIWWKTCRNRNLWNTTESFFSLSMIWREFWRQSFWFCWDFNTRMECYQCHQCREMDLGVTNQVWQRQKGLLKDGWLMMASAKSENTGDWITVKQCETCLSSADIMFIRFQVKPSKHWLHYIPTK